MFDISPTKATLGLIARKKKSCRNIEVACVIVYARFNTDGPSIYQVSQVKGKFLVTTEKILLMIVLTKA